MLKLSREQLNIEKELHKEQQDYQLSLIKDEEVRTTEKNKFILASDKAAIEQK